jgi:ketosteroid isomerase-like protein
MADLTEALQRLVDEAEIKRLGLGYAQAVDRRDMAALTSLFTPDGSIEGAGVERRGHEQIGRIAARLDRLYDRTYHTVFNQTVAIDGAAAAEGEVYSTAHHLKRQDDGRTSDYVMVITYRDRYVRTESGWRFAERRLDLQWTQTVWVEVDGKV